MFKGTSIIRIVGIITIIIICAIVIIGINSANSNSYNNGICIKCGGHYKLYDIVATKSYPLYYYKCDSCEHVISTSMLME